MAQTAIFAAPGQQEECADICADEASSLQQAGADADAEAPTLIKSADAANAFSRSLRQFISSSFNDLGR